MPFVFIRWLLWRFARNVAALAIALTLLLTVFDLLAKASEVALGADQPALALLFYMIFRLPIIGVFILPFAVLAASVQTFGSLASHREILALESSGFTQSRIVLVLVAGAGILATLQFVFADRIVTDATERLNEWKADAYQGLPKLKITPTAPEWLADGNLIVHMAGVSPDGTRLQAPTVIEMDEAGVATRYWNAREATHDGKDWMLEDAAGRDLASRTSLHQKRQPLPMAVLPQTFSSYAKPVEELRFSQLWSLGWSPIETQTQPTELYRVWTLFRLAQPLGGIVMVLLAAPICLQIQRGGRRVLVSTAVFAMGFLYFILQNILLALGEGGDLSPMLAAWGAFASFGCVGLVAVIFRLR